MAISTPTSLTSTAGASGDAQTTGGTRAPHPVYQSLKPIWELLAEAAEGTGRFSDGTAIIPHPREYLDHSTRLAETDATTGVTTYRWVQNENPQKPTKKLLERRKLARYENWPDTILTLLAGGLFRKAPVRRAETGNEDPNADPHPYIAWCANVDGRGTPIDAYWARSWRAAAVFGHTFHVLDRAAVESATAADAGAFYVRCYQPLDVVDWLTDELGFLTAIRALEAVPRTSFADGDTETQAREITPEGWAVFPMDKGGRSSRAALEQGLHDFQGSLPVVVLKGKARPLSVVIGQSVLGDPFLYLDDYNLTSEIRELLRKQTFSLLNVPLGVSASGGPAFSLEEAQNMMGQSTGTGNVIFTPLSAAFLSADTTNVTVYQTEQDRLRRTMFRLAGLPWEADSRAAESAESRRIKREDINQTLALYADLIESADKQLAQLWFKGTYGERWQDEWDNAQVVIDWPDTFDSEVLDDLLNRTALALDQVSVSKTFVAEIRKTVAQKMLPNLPSEKRQEIEAEIENALSAEEQQQQQRQDRMTRMAQPPMEGEGMPMDDREDTAEGMGNAPA